MGVEYHTDTFGAQLTYFDSSSNFGQRLQADADGIYTVKREKTEIDGLELSLNWAASEQDQFGLRYAQLSGRFDSNADGRVDTGLSGANIAPDRVNLSWEQQWTPSLSTRLQANRLQDRSFSNRTGAITRTFEGYTTYDLSARWQLQSGSVSLGMQNLADKTYFTYHSQTAGSNSRNFRGVGRTISLSYDMPF